MIVGTVSEMFYDVLNGSSLDTDTKAYLCHRFAEDFPVIGPDLIVGKRLFEMHKDDVRGYATLGDACLATSFFKDLGEAGYLVLIGTSAYTNAGARAERVLHPVMKGIYNELGEKFIYVASLLAKVFGRDLVLDNLVQLDAHFSSYRDLRSYQALMDKGLLIGNTSDS